MNHKQLQVGFIGTGGISILHGKQLKELPEVNIAAIADISESSRESFVSQASAPGVLQFSDYLHMLDNTILDAVVICSPHTMHYQQAKDALQRDIHVLIEKPLACTSQETTELVALAEAKEKVLQVSYQRHFWPVYRYVKQTIDEGRIGKLTSVTASLHQGWKQAFGGTWRLDPSMSGGGMLMDSGSHILDVLLWTTGLTPKEVSVKMHNQGTPVEIDSFTAISFEEGAIAGVNMVGSSPFQHEHYIYCGEKGAIHVTNGDIRILPFRQEPVVPELPPQTSNPDKSFIDAVYGRHEVEVPGLFAQKVVLLTEMIYKAAGYQP